MLHPICPGNIDQSKGVNQHQWGDELWNQDAITRWRKMEPRFLATWDAWHNSFWTILEQNSGIPVGSNKPIPIPVGSNLGCHGSKSRGMTLHLRVWCSPGSNHWENFDPKLNEGCCKVGRRWVGVTQFPKQYIYISLSHNCNIHTQLYIIYIYYTYINTHNMCAHTHIHVHSLLMIVDCTTWIYWHGNVLYNNWMRWTSNNSVITQWTTPPWAKWNCSCYLMDLEMGLEYFDGTGTGRLSFLWSLLV